MAKRMNPMLLKNKAKCVVFSWMRSWSVEVRLPDRPEEGDLVVAGKSVVFNEERAPGEHAFALAPSAILSPDIRVTLAELHRLTDWLGCGRPAGPRCLDTTRRAASSDYLAVSMRLTAFSRVPNIPIADIRKYEKILKRESDRAGRRFAHLLTNMGLERSTRMTKGDLYNIGLVFLLNYLNRHQDLGDEKQNGADLTLWFVQEFGHWADVTIRHLRTTAPVTAGVPVDCLMGSPCPGAVLEDAHGTDQEAAYTVDVERLDETPSDEPVHFNSEIEREKWMRKKAMRDGRYHAKRRRNARVLLDTALSEMTHDRMVNVLQEVESSDFQHPDAREEAGRRLSAHRATCKSGCRTQ